MMHELGIATLNLENGERIDLLPELVAWVPRLDVFMLQEGRGWDCRGQRRRFQAESLLAPLGLDRSFLTRSTRGTLHELVFIRSARMRHSRTTPRTCPMCSTTRSEPSSCSRAD
jgi:hypothetical protein